MTSLWLALVACVTYPTKECCESTWTATLTLPGETRGPEAFLEERDGIEQTATGIWLTVPRSGCLQAWSVSMGDVDPENPERFHARLPLREQPSFSVRDYIGALTWGTGSDASFARLEGADILPMEVGPNRVEVEFRNGCIRHGSELECNPQPAPIFFEMEGEGTAGLLALDVEQSPWFDLQTGRALCTYASRSQGSLP